MEKLVYRRGKKGKEKQNKTQVISTMFAFPCLNHSIPSTRIFMVHLKTNHNAKETSKFVRKAKLRGEAGREVGQ